jgi:hypothetical protein
MTRYENYQEALRFAREAEEAFDQAISCMKAAKVEANAGGYRKPTEKQVMSDIIAIVADLASAKCEDCDKPLAECKCAWLAAEAR